MFNRYVRVCLGFLVAISLSFPNVRKMVTLVDGTIVVSSAGTYSLDGPLNLPNITSGSIGSSAIDVVQTINKLQQALNQANAAILALQNQVAAQQTTTSQAILNLQAQLVSLNTSTQTSKSALMTTNGLVNGQVLSGSVPVPASGGAFQLGGSTSTIGNKISYDVNSYIVHLAANTNFFAQSIIQSGGGTNCNAASCSLGFTFQQGSGLTSFITNAGAAFTSTYSQETFPSTALISTGSSGGSVSVVMYANTGAVTAWGGSASYLLVKEL